MNLSPLCPALKETLYCQIIIASENLKCLFHLYSHFGFDFPKFINLAVVNPVKEVNPSPLNTEVI